MSRAWWAIALVGFFVPSTGCGGEEPAGAEQRYWGMSDASAAVALGTGLFVAADDENNVLKVYSAAQVGHEIAAFDWNEHLGIRPGSEHPEADIEGATVLGDRIFWITSHGRNRDGKWRPNRHRLLAMTVARTDQGLQATPLGHAYDRLAVQLLSLPQSDELGMTAALGPLGSNDKDLAPKDEGLNIEGLAATPDGKSLLIGFRNPVPHAKALLLPLLNPLEVVNDQATPQLGQPILLDLSVRRSGKTYGLGIRSIEYSRRHGGYLIVAGPPDTRHVFALFHWSGRARDRARLLAAADSVLQQKDFTPEALIVYSRSRSDSAAQR